jgi:hypothetical protein
MRGLLKFSLLAATVLSPFYAQSAKSPDALPPAMQGAIDRVIKGDPASGRIIFQNPASTALVSPAETCSVPLLEMHIDPAERFTMRTAPAHAINDPMPRAHAPAPACDQTAPLAPAQPPAR